MAGSANVHASEPTRVALFEPVHGSAPPLAGKDVANPFAALLTAGMLLAHVGYPDEELRIERWVSVALEEGACTVDVGGKLGTRAAAAWVRERIASEL
jgi:3-isopropylmalate dehydrogenase